MRGVWKHERTGKAIRVEVQPFAKLTKLQNRAIEDETERLGDFLDASPELTIHEPGAITLY
jgi:hypothetical protein